MVTIETVDESAESAAAAAEAAREAAEARRRKILDSANDRLGLVEGRTAQEQAEADAKAAAAAPTPGASSRMAAMRRRRFKTGKPAAGAKKEETAAAAAADEKAEKKDDAKAAAAAKAKDSDDEKEDDAPAAAAETKEEEPAKTEETAPPPSTRETAEEKASDEQHQPKKKYQGVAKMRRRMLKERQAKQAEQQQSSPDETAAAAATATASKEDAATAVQQVAAQKAKLLSKRRSPLLPILMHAVTVLLLFLAGLDVGLQQRSIDYYYDYDSNSGVVAPLLTVHTELAPRRQLGGMAVVNRWMMLGKNAPPAAAAEDGISPNARAVLADDEWQPDASEPDEFADAATDGPKPSGSSTGNNNIDPLFRVDLDQITAGPGALLWLGRGAVRAHRLNLAIFWYGPRNFFLGLADWLQSLTTSPPVLCLAAIVLRQLVGKLVLGARLPARVEDEAQHKDVMSMVKLFVSNFVLRSFPNAVQLYDVWTHVRADMYVLLCGLFVGLAYSHSGRGSGVLEGDTTTTVPQMEEEQPPAATEGISDEL